MLLKLDIWTLIAGLSLFLFGMKQLETALKQMTGKKFKFFISQSTNQPVKSIFTGIIATTIMQSSSLVGLLVLAFVGAGMMPLANAIAVVLGSNLGTTFTGWVVATLGFKMNLSALVYPLLGIGGLGYVLSNNKLKAFSLFVFGFGMLLMGLGFMKESVQAFTSSLNLEVLAGLPLIIYLLFGVIVTAIIQSSSAVMMLTLTALYGDVLMLPEAAAVVIGADLGTSSTVLLGSIGGSVAQKRLALAQVIFNAVVDVFAFLFIEYLLSFIGMVGIQDPLVGLVAFHSLFNLIGLIIFIPFITQYSHFLEKIVKLDSDETQLTDYIQNVPKDVSDAALKALNLETKRLMSLVLILNLKVLKIESELLNNITVPFAFSNRTNLAFYESIKELEGEIINYALSVQTTKSHVPIDEAGDQNMAHQIDHYMKANRASIYAAKSLKDIHENLDAFNHIENPKLIEIYSEIISSTERIYGEIIEMMAQEGGLNAESLQHLREKTIQSHQYFRSQIHQHMSSQSIGSFNLSTLLNVNQEIYASENAMIDGLTELFSAETCPFQAASH